MTQGISARWQFRLTAFAITLIEASVRRILTVTQQLRYWAALRFIYRARPDDLFIVSYPKAGTTAMQMMLYQITTDGGMSFRHIDDVIPWFERWLMSNPSALENRPSPRVFKTHLSLNRLPTDARCIYLIREPKDSCVSYFYHNMSLGGMRLGLPAFVQRFLCGTVPLGSWFDHLAASLRVIPQRRVLVVAYDDIVNRTTSVIDRVAEFAGQDLDSDKRSRVLTRCGFAFMKQHNDKFDPRLTGGALRLNETQFIRRGTVASWVDDLSPSLARMIDDRLAETVKDLGSAIPDDCLRVLQPTGRGVRGTMSVNLDADRRHSLYYADDTETVFRLRIAFGVDALDLGDLVRLRLIFADGKEVDMPHAKVVNVGGDRYTRSAELQFSCADNEDAKLLAVRCDCHAAVGLRGHDGSPVG